ncbi:MAG: TonB C-terminal domain-containing protein [Geobacter sp.]|nr:TonB C-terminal domain-containing protein [Geobacter sp.]
MIQRVVDVDPKPGRFILFSLVLHLCVATLFSAAGLLKPRLKEVTPYYVDIVSLPTVAPPPTATEPPAAPVQPAMQAAPPAAAKASPAKPAMTLPGKSSPAKPTAGPSQESREQESREFAERMSRLEYGSEARHQAAALAALQKKAADKRAATTQGGGDKGVDYGAYIQSRLKDALASTIVYRTKSPETAVHIYIDKSGRLARYVVEKASNDKLFNDSVIRTIEKAKVDFPPTPTPAGFDKLFVFSPQEVTNK